MTNSFVLLNEQTRDIANGTKLKVSEKNSFDEILYSIMKMCFT